MIAGRMTTYTAALAAVLLFATPTTCVERYRTKLQARTSPPPSRPTSPTTGLLSDVQRHVAKHSTSAPSSSAQRSHSQPTHSSAHASQTTAVHASHTPAIHASHTPAAHASSAAAGHGGSSTNPGVGRSTAHTLAHSASRTVADMAAAARPAKSRGRPAGSKNAPKIPRGAVVQGPKNKPGRRAGSEPWWKRPGGTANAPKGSGKRQMQKQAEQSQAGKKTKSNDTHPSSGGGRPRSPGSPGGTAHAAH